MKTFKMQFAYLTLMLTCLSFALIAQNDHTDGHKWGAHPDDFNPPFTQAVLEAAGFQPSCHLSRTKAIYKAFLQGDVIAFTTNIAKEVDWNGEYNFPYPIGDPHYNINGISELLFDKIGKNYSHWEVQILTFEEQYNNTVTVNGTYEATRANLTIRVPFVHTWVWKGNYIDKFQHYEAVQNIAERH